ncbi:uncharacterized protein VirK/YbjX [Bradyrhizobium sp. USDA 4459]
MPPAKRNTNLMMAAAVTLKAPPFSRLSSMVGFVLAMIRHARLVLPILMSRPSSAVGRYFRSRPELLELLHGRFIADNWDEPTKLRAALNHIETVRAIGYPLDFPPDQFIDLMSLNSIGDGYRLSLDQPRWLLREGQLALSLWEGVDRLFCITFSLRTEGLERTAFVGGLQGRRQVEGEEDVLERYRRFTKLAQGSRPRDFIIEMFRTFCRATGVTRIRAVSDANHPLKGRNEGFTLRYDEAWLDRGGEDDGSGFFELGLMRPDKPIDDVPAKKRSQYRKRIAMFNEIEQQFLSALSGRAPTVQRAAVPEQHAPVESSSLGTLLLILALGLAVGVLAETGRLGGTWIGFGIGLVFVVLTYWILKGKFPEQTRARISGILWLRKRPTILRVAGASLILALAIAIDVKWGGTYALGRAFKLYFVPVFVSSLCFGTTITLGVMVCAVAAINYLHLPPVYSFSFSSWADLKDMLDFLAAASLVLLIPRLILVSVDVSAEAQNIRNS